MPTVVLDVKDANGNSITAITVTVDDASFAEHLDGTALSVEPGKHRFRFTMKGVSPVEKELTFREGEKGRHESVLLTTSVADEQDPGADIQSHSAATGAYIALGIGGVGLVAGAIFTVVALEVKAKCPNDAGETSCPPPIDNQENDAAVKRDSLFAGIGYGVGVLGGAIGLWLLFSNKPRKAETTPSPSGMTVRPLLGMRWLGVGGRF
jgi:hypothetical protein